MTTDTRAGWNALEQAQLDGAVVAPEPVSKAVVASLGIALPKGRVATSPQAAASVAQLVGWPVVVKIVGADLPHKSEHGGVAGPLRSTDAVLAAADRILGAGTTHVMVERWMEHGLACFIGVDLRGRFGPTVSFGVGGIWVEVLRDVSHRVAPVDEREARDMVLQLKAAPIFQGARGHEAVDLAALAAAIARISMIALSNDAHRLINDLEVNPLLALAHGAPVALDAAIAIRRPADLQ